MSTAMEVVAVTRGARSTRLAMVRQLPASAYTYTPPDARAQALAWGATGLWTLGETDPHASVAVDATTNGHDATNVAQRVVFGRPGAIPTDPTTAGWFDGGATLTLPATTWQPGIAGFTLGCWFKTRQSGVASTLIGVTWAGRVISLGLTVDDTLLGSLDPTSTVLSTYETSDTYVEGNWHHAALVVPNDGTDVRVVVDGATAFADTGLTNGPFFPNQPWTIGEGFRGTLQHVVFVPSALTDDDLSAYVDFARGRRRTRLFPKAPTADLSRVPRVPTNATVVAAGGLGSNPSGTPLDVAITLGDQATQRPTGDAPNTGGVALFTAVTPSGAVWTGLAGTAASDSVCLDSTAGVTSQLALTRMPTPASVAQVARVTVQASARLTAGTAALFRLVVAEGTGAVRYLTSATITSGSYTPLRLALGRNPFTNAAWHAEDVGAYAWGVLVTPFDAAAVLRVSALSVVVDYVGTVPTWLGATNVWAVPYDADGVTVRVPNFDTDAPEGWSGGAQLYFPATPPKAPAGPWAYYAILSDVFGRPTRPLGPTRLVQA